MDDDITTLKKPFKEIGDDLKGTLKTPVQAPAPEYEDSTTDPESEPAAGQDIAGTVSPSEQGGTDRKPEPNSGINHNG